MPGLDGSGSSGDESEPEEALAALPAKPLQAALPRGAPIVGSHVVHSALRFLLWSKDPTRCKSSLHIGTGLCRRCS